jgi:hypothetical protein
MKPMIVPVTTDPRWNTSQALDHESVFRKAIRRQLVHMEAQSDALPRSSGVRQLVHTCIADRILREISRSTLFLSATFKAIRGFETSLAAW